MDVLLTVVGLLGGVLLSLLVWWVLAHRIVPELSFSEQISKLPHQGRRKVAYRVKVQNTGRRDIIDISLRARVYLPGVHLLRPGAKKTTTIVEVPLDGDTIFILRRGQNRLPWLEVQRIVERSTDLLSPELARQLGEASDGSLEALMGLSDRSYVLIQALAYDAVSGARKYYASPRYGIDDVIVGTFNGLAVVEDPDAAPPAVEEVELTVGDERPPAPL